MLEVKGDLWGYRSSNQVLCIPTNRTTKSEGLAVMGAGLALECVTRIPGVPALLGRKIIENPDLLITELGFWHAALVLAYPTKEHWRDNARIQLIERSAKCLIKKADEHPEWTQIILPRVGCGYGSLNWRDVFPVLNGLFDDRFVICSPKLCP